MGEGKRRAPPLPPAEPPSRRQFIAPSEEAGWHRFGQQHAALDFVQPLQTVWALEKNGTGARSYIVATREDFWRRYRTLPCAFRHHYELIRAECPCHLYLDIEFCRRANPDADGDRMMVTLLCELRAALRKLLGLEDGGTDDSAEWLQVVDLDSSGPTKFSRHLILRLRGGATAFADNAHCGRFILGLFAELRSRRDAEPPIAELFVAPPIAATADDAPPPAAAAEATEDAAGAAVGDSSTRVCIVDLSVYTRHRCFRLYKSSKLGKRAQLLPAHTTEEERFFMSHLDETKLFMESLVTNVEPDAVLLRVEGDATATGAGAGSQTSHARLLRAPAAAAARQLLPGDCPHAELTEFVLGAWAHKTGLGAYTSRWSIDATPGAEVLTLALGPENRWCAHVQRPHRSNGTLLRVDLRQHSFAQFCFDADCRAGGFRGSDWLPVPAQLCQSALPPSLSAAAADEDAPTSTPGASDADWLLGDEVLASLPIDEIVAAHEMDASQESWMEEPLGSDATWQSEQSRAPGDTDGFRVD